MLYLLSDIHGEYDLFMRLLEKIRFSKEDSMIICGDILDKGPDCVKLAKFVFRTPNIRCILGNHEYSFLNYYEAMMKAVSQNFDEVLQTLQHYFPDGHLLDWETIDAIEALPAYIEEKEFICVHAGLPLGINGEILPLEKAAVDQLVNDRGFKEPNVLPKGEKCVFFGHTPTYYVSGEEKILRYPKVENPKKLSDYYKIHLDMGTMTSGVLGCICVDTWEEFYVTKFR